MATTSSDFLSLTPILVPEIFTKLATCDLLNLTRVNHTLLNLCQGADNLWKKIIREEYHDYYSSKPTLISWFEHYLVIVRSTNLTINPGDHQVRSFLLNKEGYINSLFHDKTGFALFFNDRRIVGLVWVHQEGLKILPAVSNNKITSLLLVQDGSNEDQAKVNQHWDNFNQDKLLSIIKQESVEDPDNFLGGLDKRNLYRFMYVLGHAGLIKI